MTIPELLHRLTRTNHIRIPPGDDDAVVRAAGLELVGDTWLPGPTTLEWILWKRGFLTKRPKGVAHA